jgi:hypothetical protein
MKPQTVEIEQNGLTEKQWNTFTEFKSLLNRKIPGYNIAWVQPVKENMIEVGIEPDRMTYEKNHQASKLAVELEDKTGVFIILR